METVRWAMGGAAVIAVAAAVVLWPRPAEDRRDPIVAGDGQEVVLLPFSSDFSLDPLPPGWTHRTFWTSPPMDLSFVTMAGRPALRCATTGGGSILSRAVNLSLDEFPQLTWTWYVERGLTGEVDETTEAGDDHPVRLFLRMADADGTPHVAEIIWSNARYAPGDYKVIGGFQHLVADGLAEHVGQWREEQADLGALYSHLSGHMAGGRLTSIGLFCDTDNTGASSIAYTTDVVAHRRP